jgi:arginine decarboxylase
MDQSRTPLFDALKKYVDDQVTPFHVPGHKQGQGLAELQDYLGQRVLKMDVNGMKDLDYINNPSGVILEAEKLCASIFAADYAYFLVNGTTSGVQAMIMSACEPGSEIIIPRNAHKSTIGGIILSGAIPVYIQPEIHKELGMAMGITVDNLKKTIKEHPHARAVFVINPTYYGVSSDLKAIVSLAHRHNMAVLVDEAHGAHMSFHEDFPITAMQAEADMSAVSIHKTAGSMTQSSVLLFKSKRLSPHWVKQVLNLSYTSSASYILLCSLDVARKQLALHGRKMLADTLELARWAREEINKIEIKENQDGDCSSIVNRTREYLSELKSANEVEIHTPKDIEIKNCKDNQQKFYIPSQKTAADRSKNMYRAVIHYEDGCEMENIRAFSVVHNLKEFASIVSYNPPDIIENNECIEAIRKDGFKIAFTSDKGLEEIEEFFNKIVFLKELQVNLVDPVNKDNFGEEEKERPLEGSSFESKVYTAKVVNDR